MKIRNKNTAHLTIDIGDVRATHQQTVCAAIEARCDTDDDTSSGVVGPSFSTSGPGSGWSREHTPADFARRAFEGGALHYVDADDGRMCSADPAERNADGEWPADSIHWTTDSVICVECPSIEEAVSDPAITAEMARSVMDTHGPCSDRGAWSDLVRRVQALAEALSGIDPDDFGAKAEGGAA